MWGTDSSLLREKLCICEIPPDCGLLCGGGVFGESASLLLLTLDVALLFFVVEELFS